MASLYWTRPWVAIGEDRLKIFNNGIIGLIKETFSYESFETVVMAVWKGFIGIGSI